MLAALTLVLAPVLQESAPDPRELFASFQHEYLALFPTLATGLGEHAYDDRWEDELAPASRAAEQALYRGYLERSARIDALALDDETRLDLELFRDLLRRHLDDLAFPEHLLPINHHEAVPFLFAEWGAGGSVQPFASERDYRNWLARIDGFEAWVTSALACMAEGMERGIVVPRLTAERAAQRLAALAVDDPRASVFWGPIRDLPEDFSPELKDELRDAYFAALDERLLPLYRRLARFVGQEYAPACRASLGWSALPDGAAWYAQRVRHFTTTELTPDEVFALGERELARLGPLLHAARPRADEAPPPASLDDEALAAAYRALAERVREPLGTLFGTVPRTPLEIRPSSYGTFYEPGVPGQRPGVFRFASGSGLVSEALFLHEAVPGHHYQMMRQRESDQPAFRKAAVQHAFVEGWGLYAEGLGPELGLYRDPRQEYARLYSETFRALRLLWDVGIHARGWSLERCAEVAAPYGFTPQDLRWELERYVAWPAQALSYEVGHQALLAQRERARAALGEAFDLRAFHELVLTTGAVPLALLEQRVATWIEARGR